MYYLEFKVGGHSWEKQNMMTIYDGGKHYDKYKCKNCGIEAKTINISTLAIKETYSKTKIFDCPNAPIKALPAKIKIGRCTAYGASFNNITQGSEHDVIDPPKGYVNDNKGVWVMVNGEPVKILNEEFTVIK